MRRDGTIFALSSGAPPAAIAVVRISGARAGLTLESLAGPLPPPRRATLRKLRAPGDPLPLDRALVLWFPAAESATGEDLAELHLHGGRAVVAAVSEALAGMEGLRLAEPGEFTRRAFLNGRIDLAEAEGLADLLAAETEAQRRHALAVAGGGLSRTVEQWREAVLAVSARVEALLDFADEGDVAQDEAAIRGEIGRIAACVAEALASPPAERLRDGVRVVIAGPPNAGKSTLLNALAGREAAIAAPRPGTTRDIIEAPVAIDGVPMILTDTAGLRTARGATERIGIGRAGTAVAGADVVLWLGAAAAAPPGSLVVHAKADLGSTGSRQSEADVSVSAITGAGLDDLRGLLLARAHDSLPRPDAIALNLRQREEAGSCRGALELARDEADPLLVAEQLRAARQALDRLTGRSGIEDMLDSLFGRFCIGK